MPALELLTPFDAIPEARLAEQSVCCLLPHELVLLDQKITHLFERQAGYTLELGAAMQDGAETDHDNGPADAVVFDADALVAGNKVLYGTWAKGWYELIDYPTDSESKITLGTRVTGSMGAAQSSAPEKVQIDITGGLWLFEEPDDLDHILTSYRSPLGQALLTHKEGERVSYIAGDRLFEVNVESVDQSALYDENIDIVKTLFEQNGQMPRASKLIELLRRTNPEQLKKSVFAQKFGQTALQLVLQ